MCSMLHQLMNKVYCGSNTRTTYFYDYYCSSDMIIYIVPLISGPWASSNLLYICYVTRQQEAIYNLLQEADNGDYCLCVGVSMS